MEDEIWLFEKDQGESKLKIKLLYGTTEISERKFKKDMKSLVDKIYIHDVNDGQDGIVSFDASYKNPENDKMRYYDLEPNFKGANICIETEGKRFFRERFVYSNKFESQLILGRKYFSIYLSNPNED